MAHCRDCRWFHPIDYECRLISGHNYTDVPDYDARLDRRAVALCATGEHEGWLFVEPDFGCVQFEQLAEDLP